jgi:hypothetical protein
MAIRTTNPATTRMIKAMELDELSPFADGGSNGADSKQSRE